MREGVIYKKCNICQKESSKILEKKTDHSYTGIYFVSETHHWVSCTDCDKIRCEEHTPNSKGVCTECNHSLTPTEGVVYNLSEDETYAIVVDYVGSSKNVVIAKEYQGVPVTSIATMAFYCTGVSSVIIPDGITSIDEAAFHSNSYLKNLHIPASVTQINGAPITWSTDLVSLTVAEENEFYHAENNCLIETKTKALIKGTNNSVIPDDGSVTSIMDDAFQGCSGLDMLFIPKSVVDIGSAFYWCFIEYIEVDPENPVYYSAGNCLINRDSKTLIKGCNSSVIPENSGIEVIGKYAFEDCGSLKSAIIPEGVTTIEHGAFFQCFSLEKVILSDSVVRIESNAFTSCRIKTLNIGSGVTYISTDSFGGIDELEEITISEDNPSYRSSGNCIIDINTKTLILGCKNSTIPNDGSVERIAYAAFKWCDNLMSITIPDGVKSIDMYAFAGCTSLKSIYIPKSVEYLSYGAFEGCDGIEEIIVDEHNEKYHSSQNCVIETATKKLVLGCKTSVIPNDGSVVAIGERAFFSCAIKKITIPEYVTYIGDSAFRYASLDKAIFVNPDGWRIKEYYIDSEYIDISAKDLLDQETAAELLCMYYDYVWERQDID